MGYRVLAAPWWVRWLLYACLFAVIELALAPLFLIDMFRDWGWPGYAVFVVVGGVIFGGLVTASTQPAHRAYLSAVAGLGTDGRERAAAALRSGEVPTDPAVLAAAIQLGENYLSRGSATTQRLVLSGVTSVVFLAGGIVYIAHGNARVGGFWIGLAVFFVAATLWDRYYRQRLQHNVETLRTAAGQLPGVSPP
jgi:hypothetical protein